MQIHHFIAYPYIGTQPIGSEVLLLFSYSYPSNKSRIIRVKGMI